MTNIKPYFTYGAKASDRDLVNSTVNYGGKLKRYFSSLDAEVFIGGERIVDINRIDFNYTEQKMPIYGFNSFLPSRIFVGQKIVQGTFVINFTEVGYIANLLDRIDGSSLSSPFDKVGISCDIYNTAMFKKCFDILIGYGGYNVPEEASLNNTCQVIRGVYINGFQQILDTSGEPIYEVYSFIAKDITFVKPEVVTQVIGKGKNIDTNISYDYGVAESRLITEADTIKRNSNNNSEYLGITTDVTHSILNNESSMINITFELSRNDDDIDNVKLTIADNEIGLSKTYSFNYFGGLWVCRLNKEDTDKIKKKLKDNKVANCLLEFELKRKDSNDIENISKQVGMYKSQGY